MPTVRSFKPGECMYSAGNLAQAEGVPELHSNEHLGPIRVEEHSPGTDPAA